MLTQAQRRDARSLLDRLVERVLGSPSLSELTEITVPAERTVVSTTSATPLTVRTISTSDDRVYSVGVRAKGWDGTQLLVKEFGFIYKNVAGTLTQVGSDQDGVSETDDGSWACSQTDSGTDILVQVTGDSVADPAVQWIVDVWWSEMPLVNSVLGD